MESSSLLDCSRNNPPPVEQFLDGIPISREMEGLVLRITKGVSNRQTGTGNSVLSKRQSSFLRLITLSRDTSVWANMNVEFEGLSGMSRWWFADIWSSMIWDQAVRINAHRSGPSCLEVGYCSTSERVSHYSAEKCYQINRPFYSFVLSRLAFEWKWGWGWPCFDRNLTAFLI